VPGMFIANGIDEPLTAHADPADRGTRARPQHAAATRPQRTGLLDQSVGVSRTARSP